MRSKSKVCFFFEYKPFSFEKRNQLKSFIEGIFKNEKKRLTSLNCIFCSDKKILEINQVFLKHDFYTDIITFNLSESDTILAEIYISIERVRENAITQGTSFKSELHRVIFHGILHLCGFRDKTKMQKVEMRKKEDFYLSLYFHLCST